MVIKDTVRDVIKIYDIKTSTMGWNKYMKADKNKTDQLLLYKQFYSKQFNHPMDRIEVEYFIVKRKLYENLDFPQKRVQKFTPANGKPSINQVVKRLDEFILKQHHGEMQWLQDRSYFRSNPRSLWPEVKTILVLGSNYPVSYTHLTLPTKRIV